MQYIHTFSPENPELIGLKYENLDIPPTIFMRHSALPRDEGEIYTCEGNAFSIDEVRVARLVLVLNECDLSNDTGVHNIESKRQPSLQLVKHHQIDLERAEILAQTYGINILGGVYCTYLEQYGIYPFPIGDLCLETTDSEILTAFYPDLSDYFNIDKGELSREYRRFVYDVIQNNVGLMKVFSAWDCTENTEGMLRKITFLKRAFRYFTHLVIKTNKADNMVHSPENLEEYELYRRLILGQISQ